MNNNKDCRVGQLTNDDQEDDGKDDDGDDVLTVRSKGGQSPTGARILTSHLPGHAHQQHHRPCHHHHHHLLHHHRAYEEGVRLVHFDGPRAA